MNAGWVKKAQRTLALGQACGLGFKREHEGPGPRNELPHHPPDPTVVGHLRAPWAQIWFQKEKAESEVKQVIRGGDWARLWSPGPQDMRDLQGNAGGWPCSPLPG